MLYTPVRLLFSANMILRHTIAGLVAEGTQGRRNFGCAICSTRQRRMVAVLSESRLQSAVKQIIERLHLAPYLFIQDQPSLISCRRWSKSSAIP
jgi:hypothetical protein